MEIKALKEQIFTDAGKQYTDGRQRRETILRRAAHQVVTINKRKSLYELQVLYQPLQYWPATKEHQSIGAEVTHGATLFLY